MRFFHQPNVNRRHGRRGFTLMETAMAQVIVGVAIAAMCQLLTVGTQSNRAAGDLTTGVNLANVIHELAVGLPFTDGGSPVIGTFHDIWDLNQTFTPPIDSRDIAISTYPNWSQQVTVQTVALNQLTSVRPNDQTVPTARVTVIILHNNQQVYQASWVVAAPDPS